MEPAAAGSGRGGSSHSLLAVAGPGPIMYAPGLHAEVWDNNDASREKPAFGVEDHGVQLLHQLSLTELPQDDDVGVVAKEESALSTPPRPANDNREDAQAWTPAFKVHHVGSNAAPSLASPAADPKPASSSPAPPPTSPVEPGRQPAAVATAAAAASSPTPHANHTKHTPEDTARISLFKPHGKKRLSGKRLLLGPRGAFVVSSVAAHSAPPDPTVSPTVSPTVGSAARASASPNTQIKGRSPSVRKPTQDTVQLPLREAQPMLPPDRPHQPRPFSAASSGSLPPSTSASSSSSSSSSSSLSSAAPALSKAPRRSRRSSPGTRQPAPQQQSQRRPQQEQRHHGPHQREQRPSPKRSPAPQGKPRVSPQRSPPKNAWISPAKAFHSARSLVGGPHPSSAVQSPPSSGTTPSKSPGAPLSASPPSPSPQRWAQPAHGAASPAKEVPWSRVEAVLHRFENIADPQLREVLKNPLRRLRRLADLHKQLVNTHWQLKTAEMGLTLELDLFVDKLTELGHICESALERLPPPSDPSLQPDSQDYDVHLAAEHELVGHVMRILYQPELSHSQRTNTPLSTAGNSSVASLSPSSANSSAYNTPARRRKR